MCDDRSLDQWEHYCLKHAYAGRSKSSSRHAGDPIETASNPPLSPASTSSVSPSPPSLPLPPPSEGMGEGSEAPSVVNIKEHVFLPLPPCPRGSMKRGGGTPHKSVVEREKSPPLPSLWPGGVGGFPAPAGYLRG